MENYKKIISSSTSHKHAIDFYSRKLKENSEMPRYNHMMAALKVKERDPESAIKYYETAIKSDPNDVMVRNDYSLLLNAKGNKIGAINEMRTALKIQDDNALLKNNLGALLSRHGDYKEAVTHAKQAVQLNPNNALNHRNLAKIYNARSELELALEHNRLAIQLEGNQGVLRPDTQSYRAAAVQIIGNRNSNSGFSTDIMICIYIYTYEYYVSITSCLHAFVSVCIILSKFMYYCKRLFLRMLCIGQRGNKDDAHELMKRARLIENKNYECKASQRSKEILTQLTQRIEEAGRISRDAAGMHTYEIMYMCFSYTILNYLPSLVVPLYFLP